MPDHSCNDCTGCKIETDPVIGLECFDSKGTVAVMVNGVDVVHIRVDQAACTADVTVFNRSAPDWGTATMAVRPITVHLIPESL